ncbi:hypothetical protein [Yoonia sp. F2084L]|uniref:hypothetical protein n=1 Tax=Yoonia sp. F2084L TaxID=2926419 RepID=UPI001FF60F88|nr:hypothetical protein [Yoonia sp. F2084L]
MSYNLIIGLMFAFIAAVFVWRAFNMVWKEAAEDRRGSDRKEGFHIIHSEYSSGMSGHHTTYKIPCDPDEYARFFIPQKTENNK